RRRVVVPRWATAALLDDVGELVSEQRVAGGRARAELAGAERDMRAEGERAGFELARQLCGAVVDVDADIAERMAERRLHARAGVALERAAGAELAGERGGVDARRAGGAGGGFAQRAHDAPDTGSHLEQVGQPAGAELVGQVVGHVAGADPGRDALAEPRGDRRQIVAGARGVARLGSVAPDRALELIGSATREPVEDLFDVG